MDRLLNEIQDQIIQRDMMHVHDQLKLVKQCLAAFKSEAYTQLDIIKTLIPKYAFTVASIKEDCADIEESTDMKDLKFKVIHITNSFMRLFQIGTYKPTDWDKETCIHSIVGHMRFQAQKDQQNQVATSTILALHFCNTFIKQMRLLCVFDEREIDPSTDLRILLFELQKYIS